MVKSLVQERLKSKERIREKQDLSETIITYCAKLRQKLTEKNKNFNSVRAIRELRSEV